MLEMTTATLASWTTLALQDASVQGVLGADGTQPGGNTPANAAAPAPGAGGMGLFMPLMLLMVAFLFISTIMGGRKERKRREAMLTSLKKRDRVQTAGGVIGTIIELKDNECLLESDRASNTRLWVARSSVATVLKSAADAGERISETTTESASV